MESTQEEAALKTAQTVERIDEEIESFVDPVGNTVRVGSQVIMASGGCRSGAKIRIGRVYKIRRVGTRRYSYTRVSIDFDYRKITQDSHLVLKVVRENASQ
jgi:hypothetical protein